MSKYIIVIIFFFIDVEISEAQMTMSLLTKEETSGINNAIPTRDIEETKNGIMVTYRFNNVVLQKDSLYIGATSVIIDGFWSNTNVGEPATLSRWDTFVVPNTGAKVIIRDSSYVEFPLQLSPARPILTNSGNDVYTKRNVIPIRSYSGLFPNSLIPATRNDNYRGQQLLDICVSPVQYDYENMRIRVFTMIKYQIQYNATALKNSLLSFSKRDLNCNSFLGNITLNFYSGDALHSLKSTISSTGNVSSKYLIVSVPKYASAVNKFAEWKRILGFDVQIAMRESWDTTMVKNVVSEACNHDIIDYLLIVGGFRDVPGVIRNRVINNKRYYYPTDLYYGCLGNGYTPDIFRGRIPVNTNDEAMTVIDKIINYEKNPVTDDSFYRTGTHCAYFQDWDYYNNGVITQPIDGYEDRRFVFTSERIRDGMLNIIDKINRVYYTEDNVTPTHWNSYEYANGNLIPVELQKPNFAWDGDSDDINTCINEKSFYVLMRDHGAESGWGSPYYTTNNIGHLSNGSYLPVVFSICCLTGKFDVDNCFCESFLKKKNGGCVAIFGATQSSLSGPNDVMTEGMFDAIWPSLNLQPRFGFIKNTSYSPTPTPTYRLGQILDQGLKRCDEAYLNTYKVWYPRYTSELFHCFGDPSMMIYTDKPTDFSGASINRVNGLVYVNTGGEIATISFYNRHTGAVESYLGTFASHADDPEMTVCISAHNKIPYIDGGMLYIQNQTLSNDTYHEARTIKVGNHVTYTQNCGDVNFIQGHHQLVGKNIELQPGTAVLSGTTLEIKNN